MGHSLFDIHFIAEELLLFIFRIFIVSEALDIVSQVLTLKSCDKIFLIC